MANAEVQYLVLEGQKNQRDVEAIVEAIGAYQATIPFQVQHTAEFLELENDAVELKLIKSFSGSRPDYELLEAAEKMRRGIESQFSEEDRARLGHYFVGIAKQGASDS